MNALDIFAPDQLTLAEEYHRRLRHVICLCGAYASGYGVELIEQGWALNVNEFDDDLCPKCKTSKPQLPETNF